MVEGLWVARLQVSAATEHKIRSKHNLEVEDVRSAVVCRPGLNYVWHDHPERGRRAIVKAWIAPTWCYVVLYPVHSAFRDEFHLGSAYPL